MKKINEYLTVSQAARCIGVSPGTIRNWEKTGWIKGYRNPNNNYRLYDPRDIDRLLNKIYRDNPRDQLIREEIRDDIKAYLLLQLPLFSSAPRRDADIFFECIATDKTLIEIGKQWDITGGRVRQIYKQCEKIIIYGNEIYKWWDA